VSGSGVSVHVAVPLHVRCRQSVDAHVTAVPEHVPPEHASPHVQRSESSHPAAVRHCHTPPAFVQRHVWPPHDTSWHSTCVVPSHAYVPPPPHVPVAPAGPHPWHWFVTVIDVAPQLSVPPHDPGFVAQPPGAAHAASQQPPAAHVACAGTHAHVAQLPAPLQKLVQLSP
jgi:hypothetical protein